MTTLATGLTGLTGAGLALAGGAWTAVTFGGFLTGGGVLYTLLAGFGGAAAGFGAASLLCCTASLISW